MTDYLKLVLIFFAAVNPANVAVAMAAAPGASARDRRTMAVVGIVAAGVLLAAAALASDRLLDLLDVAPETFRIAAGIVMVTAGVRALWGNSHGAEEVAEGWRGGLFPLGVPLLAGPAAVAATISYGVDEGKGIAFGAVVPAIILAAALCLASADRRALRSPLRAAMMLTGALLVGAGAGLVVEGVRAI